MTKSNAERQRDYQRRKLLKITLPVCQYCGITLKSDSTRERLCCSNCFPSTVEGMEANRERQIKFLKKKKQLKNNE